LKTHVPVDYQADSMHGGYLFELTQQVATVHAVCLIIYRDVCLQVLS